MATQSNHSDDMSALSNQVAKLLRGYERFTLQSDVPGILGYTAQLRSAVMVHQKHTKKGQFRQHEVFQGAQFTDLPPFEFFKLWLEKARKAAERHINLGEGSEQKIINGEWQTVKYKYDRWVYYDHKNQATIGEVRSVTKSPNKPNLFKEN